MHYNYNYYTTIMALLYVHHPDLVMNAYTSQVERAHAATSIV